jgi:hypothetical protein
MYYARSDDEKGWLRVMALRAGYVKFQKQIVA